MEELNKIEKAFGLKKHRNIEYYRNLMNRIEYHFRLSRLDEYTNNKWAELCFLCQHVVLDYWTADGSKIEWSVNNHYEKFPKFAK